MGGEGKFVAWPVTELSSDDPTPRLWSLRRGQTLRLAVLDIPNYKLVLVADEVTVTFTRRLMAVDDEGYYIDWEGDSHEQKKTSARIVMMADSIRYSFEQERIQLRIARPPSKSEGSSHFSVLYDASVCDAMEKLLRA